MDTTAALVVVLDRAGRIVRFNRASERLSGYAQAEVLGRSVWELLLLPGEVGRVQQVFAKLSQGSRADQNENWWVCKSGRRRLISWSNTALYDEQGELAYVVATGLDITAQRCMEEDLQWANAELERRVSERTAGLEEEIARREEVEAALRASETNLRSLLENAAGFAVYRVAVDQVSPFTGRILLVSPSLRELTGIRDPHDFSCYFENLHPDDHARILRANQEAFTNKTNYNEVVRVYHPGKAKWVWLHTISNPILDERGEVSHFNGMIVDVTEQKQAEEARQHLLAFEEIVTSISTRFINLETAQIDEGIQQALQIIGEFAGDDRSYVFRFSEDRQRMSCVYEWCAPGVDPAIELVQDIPVERMRWSNSRLLAKEVLNIERVAELPPEAQAEKEEFASQDIVSLLAVPMQHQGQVIGFLGFDSVRQEKRWSSESIALLRIVGEIFVNALERKQAQQSLEQAYQTLELRVEERTHQLEERRQAAESLRDILALINSNRPLCEVLDFILQQACRLVKAEAGVVYRFDLDESLSYPEATVGMPPGFQEIGPFPLVKWGPQKEVLERQPAVLEDIQPRLEEVLSRPEEVDPRLLGWARSLAGRFRAYLSAPLLLGSRLYGAISLVYAEPRRFSQDEVDLVVTFAGQASLAIENAWLRTQAENAAVLAERSRIARDLHDAVTQTLFAASLIAEVLPVIWDRKPEEARRRLEEIRRLNKAALAEMRTLLLELKPSALLDAEVRELFRHLCDAFSGRTQVPVELDLDETIDLPPEAKVVFYRIAQEALNNITKHAAAGLVWLSLRRVSAAGREQIELSLRDDGQGFDQAQVSFENLGLGIMRERAESLGAAFALKAQPGQGVEIRVVLEGGKPEL